MNKNRDENTDELKEIQGILSIENKPILEKTVNIVGKKRSQLSIKIPKGIAEKMEINPETDTFNFSVIRDTDNKEGKLKLEVTLKKR